MFYHSESDSIVKPYEGSVSTLNQNLLKMIEKSNLLVHFISVYKIIMRQKPNYINIPDEI